MFLQVIPARLLSGFVAGFLATLIFHQLVLVVLWSARVAPFGPFQMALDQTLRGSGGILPGLLGGCLGPSLCAD